MDGAHLSKFTFYGKLETKSTEGKKYLVSGYASTGDIDLVGDIVTPGCMEDMLEQIRGRQVMVDMDHEAFFEGNMRPNLIPVAKIVDAKIDRKGLWIQAEMNPHISRFGEIWGSIQDGFVNAFSITYRAEKFAHKSLGNKVARILDKVQLFNVALTGNPINGTAQIDGIMVKSLRQALEEIPVEETPTQDPAPAASEPQAATQEPTPTPAAEPAVPATPDYSAKIAALEARLTAIEAKSQATVEVEAKSAKAVEQIAALQAETKSLGEKYAALETENKSLKEALNKPLFKGIARKSNTTPAHSTEQKVDIIGLCQ